MTCTLPKADSRARLVQLALPDQRQDPATQRDGPSTRGRRCVSTREVSVSVPRAVVGPRGRSWVLPGGAHWRLLCKPDFIVETHARRTAKMSVNRTAGSHGNADLTLSHTVWRLLVGTRPGARSWLLQGQIGGSMESGWGSNPRLRAKSRNSALGLGRATRASSIPIGRGGASSHWKLTRFERATTQPAWGSLTLRIHSVLHLRPALGCIFSRR